MLLLDVSSDVQSSCVTLGCDVLSVCYFWMSHLMY